MEDEILGSQLFWSEELRNEMAESLGIPSHLLTEFEEEEIPVTFDMTGNPMYIIAAAKDSRKKREIIGDIIHELQSYTRT